MNRTVVLLVLTSLAGSAGPARGEVQRDRFSVGGYFRIMARPDLQGGEARLGLWNLYGRLLNEGPWGALEMRLQMLQPDPGSRDVWASAHLKVEGGSFAGAEGRNGSLTAFGATQLYVKAGNILLDKVTWQLGMLESYFGDLGLYDMRPAQIFFETVGLSARYEGQRVDLLLGVGDAGFFLRGLDYSTVLSLGGALRLRAVPGHLELGLGGQLFVEPAVRGNRNAPHRTPLPANANYVDFVRGELGERFLEKNPGQLDAFPDPEPVTATSFKLVAYLGFGNLGPLRWNNLFANFLRRHPEVRTTETVADRELTIYTAELTDERYQLNVGNELQLELWPRRLDLVWGVLLGYHVNKDNEVVASEEARLYFSTVVRLQGYLSETLHLLLETSLAQERSLNGNLWRSHHDSVFVSNDGRADSRGLEFGDIDARNTWQLKTGVVLNPAGLGVFTRPSLRLLFGLQHSNMHNAFGNSFVETLDQFDAFKEDRDRNWHAVIGIETEGWF